MLPKFHRLNNEWYSLVHKNIELEKVCDSLEAELNKLQTEKGITDDMEL